MSTSHPYAFLDDYCPRCNPLGIYADRLVRSASLTEPYAVDYHGGRNVLCHYQCDGCDHRWTCSDWTPEAAGLDPKQRKAA